eukprot:4652833-Amphidinium_carterae.1
MLSKYFGGFATPNRPTMFVRILLLLISLGLGFGVDFMEGVGSRRFPNSGVGLERKWLSNASPKQHCPKRIKI